FLPPGPEPVPAASGGGDENRSQLVASAVDDAGERGRRETRATYHSPATHAISAVDPRARRWICVKREVRRPAGTALAKDGILEISPGPDIAARPGSCVFLNRAGSAARTSPAGLRRYL